MLPRRQGQRRPTWEAVWADEKAQGTQRTMDDG